MAWQESFPNVSTFSRRFKFTAGAVIGRYLSFMLTNLKGAFLLFHLFNAIPKGIVMIMPTSGAIPSAEGLVEGLKQAPADVAVIVPSIVHELSQSPELLDYCAKNLEAIFYCGGDLPKSTGDIIASKIKLYNQFGASEIGLTAQIWPNRERDPKDWKYVQFHPALGIELRPVTDEIHELYVVRDPNKKEQQHAFTLFPDTREYRSRDLFVRHPSREKSDLWSWHARADDIIVFLNGEKTNPISMEQHIVSSVPEVAAALVVGAQRFQPALLIEIKRTTNDKELSLNELAAFIEKMWPAIEEANQDAPTHAQIFKSHILFTHPERPMLRAGKGTIQRSGTLQLYASEIDALYADANRLSESEDARSLDIIDDTTVSRFIRETIMSITKFPELGDKENFFTLGMDSLQTLIAVRRLKRGLAIPEIAPSTIYMNSSVTDLTAALLRLLEQHHISEASQKQSRIQEVNSILKEYQESVDQVLMPSKSIAKICEHNVILTGSTGGLGSHILHTLMNAPVAHIYCLNRATDSVSLQEKRNRAYGLPTHADSKRVTFLTSDLSKVNLGLEPSVFNELQSKTTLIIHNAWPVNFNIPLPAFRPQLDGILNLIRFAADAAASPHLFFISSISSVMSYRSDSLKTSEGIVSDVSAPGPNAYAQSKYISEHILNHAAQRLSISSSIARVGQVAGAVSHKGLWNTSEWFPSLVMSSFHLGAMPDDLGYMSVIDWVPIDLLAEVLVELALNADSRENQDLQPQSPTKGRITQTSPRIFHPLNPHSITWDIIYPMIASIFSSSTTRKPLRTVSFSSWIEKVRQDMEATAGSRKELREEELAEALRQNPAAKLLDFYEGLLSGHERTPNRLETRMTEAASGKMRGLERIKGEWIEKWVREWLSELS